MKSLFFSCVFFIALSVAAQVPTQTELLQKMNDAAALIDQGKYEQANDELLYVISNITPLPIDIAYYFGRNSYHLKKYKQSINWLNKYLQLKGTQGKFYDPASKYLELSEDAYLKEIRSRTQQMQQDIASGDYDCGGLEKMICPVCKGQGVVIKPGPMDWIYQTCPYSAGEPYLSCEDYNLYMRGKLEPKLQN